MDRGSRGAALVSVGSLTLVVMAMLVKQVGAHIPTIEILFFRSLIGFFFVLPMFIRNPMEPLRTKRLVGHFARGIIGTLGNITFFWTLTHMLLADAMTLQFSRPLFMLPLAFIFLGEIVGWRRIVVTLVGFAGIALYARPFTAGFEPGAFVGAAAGVARRAGGDLHQAVGEDRADADDHVSTTPSAMRCTRSSRRSGFGSRRTVRPGVACAGRVSWHLGQGLITQGLTLGDATALVPLDYSRIVYSAVLGYLVFGELPGPWSFAGMAMIVASSLYLVLTERRR